VASLISATASWRVRATDMKRRSDRRPPARTQPPRRWATMIPDAWACNPNTMVRAAGTTCPGTTRLSRCRWRRRPAGFETRPSPSVQRRPLVVPAPEVRVHVGDHEQLRLASQVRNRQCAGDSVPPLALSAESDQRASRPGRPSQGDAGRVIDGDVTGETWYVNNPVDHHYAACLVSREYGYLLGLVKGC